MTAPQTTGRTAVLVDKDGTLVEDVAYNADPALIEWRPGALEALARLRDAGHAIVLVSNQAGIAHGIFSEDALSTYLAALEDRLRAEADVELAGVEYCPHHPEAALRRYRRVCVCRKPNPGMLVRSARSHGFDLARSWMVGDILDDIEAGGRAGCSTVLVTGTALNEYLPITGVRRPDFIAPDMLRAAETILSTRTEVAV